MSEQQKYFSTQDGTELFYRYRPAADGLADKAIVLFHRGHEHGGRMAHLADELDMPGYDFFAWDARGNGRSPGPRGDAPGFMGLVRDLQAFVSHLQAMPLVYVGAMWLTYFLCFLMILRTGAQLGMLIIIIAVLNIIAALLAKYLAPKSR